MASFLITGGCGFIGSHLADALERVGHCVRILDDLSTGRPDNLDCDANVLIGDIRDRDAIEAAMEGVDGCFHLAAISSVLRSHQDLIGTHKINLEGSLRVFDAAARRGIPVVYASSAAVYGNFNAERLNEAMPTMPISPYGIDKLAGEMHARVVSLSHRIPMVGLRFFNVYGPRQDPGSTYSGVISVFRERLANGEPLAVFGTGEQVRDFVHVRDIVRHLLVAMDTPAPRPLVFNVCTGRGTSINVLAELLAETMGVKPVIVHGPGRPGDPLRSIGDPISAAKYFGIVAETALADGLVSLLDQPSASPLAPLAKAIGGLATGGWDAAGPAPLPSTTVRAPPGQVPRDAKHSPLGQCNAQEEGRLGPTAQPLKPFDDVADRSLP